MSDQKAKAAIIPASVIRLFLVGRPSLSLRISSTDAATAQALLGDLEGRGVSVERVLR